MLDWLRNLLGTSHVTQRHLNESGIAVAHPGDTVVFSVARRLSPAQRESLRDMIKGMEVQYPGVRFMCIECVTGVVVIPASGPEQ